MDGLLPVLCFIAGFALAWFVLRSRKRESEAALRELSADAAAKNTQALASVVAPVQASLEKVDAKIQELEKSRAGAYAALHEQVRSLLETQLHLRTETGRLVTALRTPHVRGNRGEIQLRRVVEMAGMLEHCDFTSQTTTVTEDARIARCPGALARRQDHRGGCQDAARGTTCARSKLPTKRSAAPPWPITRGKCAHTWRRLPGNGIGSSSTTRRNLLSCSCPASVSSAPRSRATRR